MSAASPEPESTEKVVSEVMTECPMCGENSLRSHCSSPQCRWQTCVRAPCDATLDKYKGIGQYRHPEGKKDPKTKVVKRVYLVLDQRGVWRERLGG